MPPPHPGADAAIKSYEQKASLEVSGLPGTAQDYDAATKPGQARLGLYTLAGAAPLPS